MAFSQKVPTEFTHRFFKRATHYNASGERLHTIYIGAAPEYGKELFLQRLQGEVDKTKKKYPKAKYVGIADGAAINWTFLAANTTYQILDFYHACEYLTGASYAYADKEAERRSWLNEACHRLKHENDGALNLLNEMKKQSKIKKLTKMRMEGLTKAIKYFSNQLDHRVELPPNLYVIRR